MVAASAALLSARRGPVLLVDLAGGDQARILGVDPSGPGLARWLLHPNPPPDSLARLELAIADGVALLPFRGSGEHAAGSAATDGGPADLDERLRLLAHLLVADERQVVVDLGLPERLVSGGAAVELESGCGSPSTFPGIAGVAERSTLVTRLCYLALARAMERPVPDDLIVVVEPDRALGVADVKAALRVPVATVRWDPAVARAVDAGLLTRRLPRALHRIPLVMPGGASDAPMAARSGGELR